MTGPEKKKTATLRGKEFQDLIWKLLEKAGLRKDLFQSNIGMDDLMDIDSKDKSNVNNAIKEGLKLKFLDTHEKMPNLNFSSALRGDIYCTALNIIVDIKNYGSSQGQMKLPGLKKEDYIKGIDSNLRYPLFYKLEDFDFLDNQAKNFDSLTDFLFMMDDLDWFKEFAKLYKNNVPVALMTKEHFADLFCFMECGYAWDLFGLNQMKGFLSKVEDTVEFKVIDLLKIKDFVTVKMHIDDNGYIFINFYDGDKCIYIISQRGWNEDFISNCSFISKEYMTLIGKVEIPEVL